MRIAVTILIVLLVATVAWLTLFPPKTAAEIIAAAQAESDAGQAEKLIRTLVNGKEQCPAKARLMASKYAADRGDYQQAVADLLPIQNSSHRALQRLADLYHQHLAQLSDAESAYRTILKQQPDDLFANDGIARLLAFCGRTQEAVPHIIKLIQAGQETDLLILLSQERGRLDDLPLLTKAMNAVPDDPNLLLGRAVAASLQQEPLQAIFLLKQALAKPRCPASAFGLLGQQLQAAGDRASLLQWAGDFQPKFATADAWFAMAALCQGTQRQQAARCLWEGLKLQPESRAATSQLAQLLQQLNQPEAAQLLHDRLAKLNDLRDIQQQTILANQQPDMEPMVQLVLAYASVQRHWETYAWGKLTAEFAPQNEELAATMRTTNDVINVLPNTLTHLSETCLAKIDLNHLPLPDLTILEQKSKDKNHAASPDIQFVEAQRRTGFDFQYQWGTVGEPTFRMFELPGGGIAAVDMNNDLLPDLFCSQGGDWSQRAAPKMVDQLFRNVLGHRFLKVPANVLPLDSGYGHGVAAGDFNNDGFADLYVANADNNQLMMNNGDGTYSSVDLPKRPKWTLSCVMADLNADGLPDLYDVNYLSANDVFDRICENDNGTAAQCAPHDFDAAVDRLLINDGQGGFVDKTQQTMNPLPEGKGMGAVVLPTDLGAGIFVSNDTTANFFYVADSSKKLVDQALLSGLAFGTDGRAEACMGIATADVNMDGQLDLHVTNFLNESNTLYSAADSNLYLDQTRVAGLERPTLNRLAFGCQFLDANLDGRQELLVANGYTHDQSANGISYQMPPQLFEWTGSEFVEHRADSVGDWLAEEFVGRSVCRIDWNADGKPDAVIGRLHSPTLLLENVSATDNRWLKLNLVATDAERSAVGAVIKVKTGSQVQTLAITAGDGYQCSNEKTLFVGCGAVKTATVDITWPSTVASDTYSLATNQSWTIVQGRQPLVIEYQSEP